MRAGQKSSGVGSIWGLDIRDWPDAHRGGALALHAHAYTSLYSADVSTFDRYAMGNTTASMVHAFMQVST